MAEYYPLLPMGCGVVVLAFLLRNLGLRAFLARHGFRAEGVVVGYRETRTSSRMVVRFHAYDGREIHATHDSTGWTAARSGDTVVINYHPLRPETARIVSAPWLSVGVRVLFGLVGGILVLTGAVLAYLHWG